MEKINTVEAYFRRKTQWKEELRSLRAIILKTEMQETIKWGFPVYTIDNKNIIGLSAFKSYFGIWFFNGVLLKDPHNVLINAQEGKTKALRQWRFKSIYEIEEQHILPYVEEAIGHQKDGKEINYSLNNIWTIPVELTNVLKKNRNLYNAYYNLTLYKQKEYAEYINEAKQLVTKQRRLKKIIPMILDGIGLNDAYRK